MKKLSIVIILILLCSNVFAWRMGRPITLTYPLDERQVRRLNDILQDLWNASNGRLNLDVVTTTKTNADNGNVWLMQTGAVVRIQYRANNTVYTVTPD